MNLFTLAGRASKMGSEALVGSVDGIVFFNPYGDWRAVRGHCAGKGPD
jgi:hypothetical protein